MITTSMKPLNNESYTNRTNYKFKTLQFGEGNFLRAFVDWTIYKGNANLGMDNGVVIVQPLAKGMVEMLQKQDNLYHVVLQGIKDGKPIEEKQLVDSVIDSVNPYSDYEKYKSYFLNPDLELIVSNTTEAGISRIDNEDLNALPPKSYPGKMCQLLYQRYKHFNGAEDKGVTIFCCELIEKNATHLREIVLELANQNNLEKEFISWLDSSCTFCNTLVDRIVPGFPKDTIKEIQADLGYEDNLVVCGEYFYLWAIEAPQKIRDKYPFEKAGLNVVWLEDMTKFRDKKVRILNGSHTALVPVGLLSGFETVKEAFEDADISEFINDMVAQEVIPNIEGDKDALKVFAEEILERFFNPYIRHFLKDISLNSLSKWMTRDYPSMKDCFEKNGKLPNHLTLSLAALLVLYKGEYNNLKFEIKDTQEYVDFIQNEWSKDQSTEAFTKAVFSNASIWDQNLDAIEGLTAKVSGYIDTIINKGIKEALKETK